MRTSGKESPITVCIVEADLSDRARLQRAIRRDSRFVCLGTFGDARTALPGITRLKPNVVVIDPPPNWQSVECIRRLREKAPESRILVWAALSNPSVAFDALDAGAAAFLEKEEASPGEVLEEIRLVDAGLHAASEGVWQLNLQAVHKYRALDGNPGILTDRQYEVARLLRERHSDKAISEMLGIALRTVHVHVWRILRKTKAHTRQQAVSKLFGFGESAPPAKAKVHGVGKK